MYEKERETAEEFTNELNDLFNDLKSSFEYEQEENIVPLNFGNGKIVNYEIIDTIDYDDDNEYAVMIPAEREGLKELSVMILRIYYDKNDEEYFESVKDPDTAKELYEIFRNRFDGMLNFAD